MDIMGILNDSCFFLKKKNYYFKKKLIINLRTIVARCGEY